MTNNAKGEGIISGQYSAEERFTEEKGKNNDVNIRSPVQREWGPWPHPACEAVQVPQPWPRHLGNYAPTSPSPRRRPEMTVHTWESAQKATPLKLKARQTLPLDRWRANLKVCWLLLPQGHLVEMTPKGPGVGTIINWWPSCLNIDNAQTSTKGPWETSPPPPHHPKQIGNLWKQVNSWSRFPPGILMPGLPIWILTKPSFTGRSHGPQPEKILWLHFFCNDCTVVTATETTSLGRAYFDPHNNLYIYMKTFNRSNLLNPQC